MTRLSPRHPRYRSLMVRARLAEAMREGLVVPEGLIAQGRAEAFDYLIGERTSPSARAAIRRAAQWVRAAQRPVLSVNGNVAALAADQVAALVRAYPRLAVEVNLFHRTDARVRMVARALRAAGVPLSSACAPGRASRTCHRTAPSSTPGHRERRPVHHTARGRRPRRGAAPHRNARDRDRPQPALAHRPGGGPDDSRRTHPGPPAAHLAPATRRTGPTEGIRPRRQPRASRGRAQDDGASAARPGAASAPAREGASRRATSLEEPLVRRVEGTDGAAVHVDLPEHRGAPEDRDDDLRARFQKALEVLRVVADVLDDHALSEARGPPADPPADRDRGVLGRVLPVPAVELERPRLEPIDADPAEMGELMPEEPAHLGARRRSLQSGKDGIDLQQRRGDLPRGEGQCTPPNADRGSAEGENLRPAGRFRRDL